MRYLISILWIFFSLSLRGQITDSSTVSQKIEEDKSGLFANRPGKAALYSLVLPGAGQFYNKSYWKTPIALGAVIGMGVQLNLQGKQHRRFRMAYFAEVRGEPHEFDDTNLTAIDLRRLRSEARQKQQTASVFFGLIWILNAAEAFVDAHLKTFDNSGDLSSLEIKPIVYPEILYSGLGLSFQF